MKRWRCEIRWCDKETNDLVYVNENIGDGSWLVGICRECADKLGLEAGNYLPDATVVKQRLGNVEVGP